MHEKFNLQILEKLLFFSHKAVRYNFERKCVELMTTFCKRDCCELASIIKLSKFYKLLRSFHASLMLLNCIRLSLEEVYIVYTVEAA